MRLPHTPSLKSGFGLLEVLVATVVLGFLIVGLNRLQLGNREAVLRIRARDAAQIVAQDFIDSLSRIGISSIPSEGDTIIGTRNYEWENKNGTTSKIEYTIGGNVIAQDSSLETSNFANTTHITAKKVDLKISWLFKNSEQSISVSRILK